jgi:hypothetical protein
VLAGAILQIKAKWSINTSLCYYPLGVGVIATNYSKKGPRMSFLKHVEVCPDRRIEDPPLILQVIEGNCLHGVRPRVAHHQGTKIWERQEIFRNIGLCMFGQDFDLFQYAGQFSPTVACRNARLTPQIASTRLKQNRRHRPPVYLAVHSHLAQTATPPGRAKAGSGHHARAELFPGFSG